MDLRAAQIDALYRAMGPANAGSLIAGGLITPLLWFDGAPVAGLIAFLVLSGVLAGLRHWLYLHYLAYPQRFPPERWGQLAALGVIAIGLVWGTSAFVLLTPVSDVTRLIYTFVCCLLSLSSLLIAIGYRLFALGATLSRILPLAVWFPLSDFAHPWFMVLALATFFFFVLLNAARLHRVFLDSLRLQAELSATTDALRRERDQAELNRQRAEMAHQMQVRFLASVSHDLRQPMQALMMLLASLGSHRLAPAPRELLTKLEMSARLMRDMFEALLELSHLRSGDIQVRDEAIDLKPLGESIATTFHSIAQTKGIHLEVQLAEGHLRADPDMLRRALFNLVDNAVKYSNGGRIVVKGELVARGAEGIRTQHRGSGTDRTNDTDRTTDADRDELANGARGADRASGDCEYLIEVRDQGIGMAPGQLETIFDDYVQLNNARRNRRDGLGLGLAIVRRSCDLMHMGLSVDSVPGKGSTFRLHIPASRYHSNRARRSERQKERTGLPKQRPARTEQFRILLIDDDVQVLESVAMLLHNEGYSLQCCDSSYAVDEALRSLEKPPDLIISDYRLGALVNGLQLIDRLREEFNQDIPAILLTGDAAVGDDEALQSGRIALEVMVKPVAPRALLESVSLALSGAFQGSGGCAAREQVPQA